MGKIYLYGSFVDLTFCKYSDIDLAVESEMGYDVFLKLFSDYLSTCPNLWGYFF